MGTPACDEGAADRGAANQTGLAGPHIDPVLELEEAGDAVGIDVVRDGGASERDGFPQDLLQGGVELAELEPAEASCHADGADAGTEEALVGVDVADAVQELLIEQGGLDGELAATEEGGEVVGGDGEGLVAGASERSGVQGQAAEAAGVDEAELTA